MPNVMTLWRQVMNKQPLSQATRAHYSREGLSDKKLEQYEKMLQAAENKMVASQSKKYSVMSAVASILVLLVVAVQFYPTQNNIAFEIAQEVAKNHIKMKPLEVETDQLSDLKKYFTQLDFALIDPGMMADKTMHGARYCSIKGVTAAQLRYTETDSTNRITIYEVEYKPEIFGKVSNLDEGMAPEEIELKGLLVKIWVEKGLLLVSAQEEMRTE